jgi:hypothetical protein
LILLLAKVQLTAKGSNGRPMLTLFPMIGVPDFGIQAIPHYLDALIPFVTVGVSEPKFLDEIEQLASFRELFIKDKTTDMIFLMNQDVIHS